MQSDLIHPNAQGDEFIAQKFYDAILSENVCIDTIVPTTFINDPASPGLTVGGTYTFKGIALDAGGSGFNRVRIAISEDGFVGLNGNPNRWFNFNTGTFGSSFQSSTATLSNVSRTSLNWQFTESLPSGSYTVYALAVDNAGNQDYYNTGVWPANRQFNVIADSQAPTSTITLPASTGANLTGGTVSGVASDTGGSGVDRVEILIRRTSTGGGFYDFNGGFCLTVTTDCKCLSLTTLVTRADGLSEILLSSLTTTNHLRAPSPCLLLLVRT